MIGSVLAGKYRIKECLGEGGTASVYRGVVEQTAERDAEPDVAIKVIHSEHLDDREFMWRFRQEAKLVAALKNPHTVQTQDFGFHEGRAYIVMELVRGNDLLDVLEREYRLSEARIARIGVQICAALAEAHAVTIVHRDLKPDNVMLAWPGSAQLESAPTDFVKVLDFGIAKILDASKVQEARRRHGHSDLDLSAMSGVSTRIGTPQYMSPEQGREEPVDARTDLYGCGVLFYEMLTGQPPFDGESALVTLLSHVNELPVPPSEYVEVDPAFEALILRALAKYPDQRHPSAESLAAELVAVMPQLHEELRPLVDPVEIVESEPMTIRRP